MVLPISDDNTGRLRTPYVTYLLIAMNVLVFVFLQGMGTNEKFTYAFSTVPQEISTGQDVSGPVRVELGDDDAVIPLQVTPGSVYLTLLVSMFMHGSLIHLLGNMLFLWIFGDNIEDDLGHVRYPVFYLGTGILASLAHVASTFWFGDNPFIPSLGASGAISGVMGGYLVMHPHRRVRVIVMRMLTTVPGGVAFMAHIGGFIAGVVLVRIFAIGARPPASGRSIYGM